MDTQGFVVGAQAAFTLAPTLIFAIGYNAGTFLPLYTVTSSLISMFAVTAGLVALRQQNLLTFALACATSLVAGGGLSIASVGFATQLSQICLLNQLAFQGCNDLANTPCVVSNTCTRLQLSGCAAPPRDVCNEVSSATKFLVFVNTMHAVVNVVASSVWLVSCFQFEAKALPSEASKVVVPSPTKSLGTGLSATQELHDTVKTLQENASKTEAMIQEHRTVLAYYGKLLGIDNVESVPRLHQAKHEVDLRPLGASQDGPKNVSTLESSEMEAAETTSDEEAGHGKSIPDAEESPGPVISPLQEGTRRHRRLELTDDDL